MMLLAARSFATFSRAFIWGWMMLALTILSDMYVWEYFGDM